MPSITLFVTGKYIKSSKASSYRGGSANGWAHQDTWCNLDINFEYTPLTSLIRVAPGLKRYEIRTKKNVIYLVRRER
ncbi:MAG TPA: hypothetical protein ENI32_03890 [Candidatus Syntrophoarchaeum butanivorans]|uniref:Uncharacterized protein n=1 Tax=Candidatus Syntropharchaeum butanivorans TaxID=1839936 RepID=A0A1F2P2T3_9EURY|nr:MAG: hypothetical protein SBU_001534 [Candidatus Syntrophoarchaeum butanivorans]HEC57009.1 hypothetical protein [Candidatus Syntrophoarchaeum butanivorans]